MTDQTLPNALPEAVGLLGMQMVIILCTLLLRMEVVPTILNGLLAPKGTSRPSLKTGKRGIQIVLLVKVKKTFDYKYVMLVRRFIADRRQILWVTF